MSLSDEINEVLFHVDYLHNLLNASKFGFVAILALTASYELTYHLSIY